jgi:hypothetical protein
MTMEDLKANKAQDNQHKELAPKYSEERNDPVASETIPTAKTNYWPPEECDDLFPIICSIQEDGTLDDGLFKEMGLYRRRFLRRYLFHRGIYTNSWSFINSYRKMIVHLLKTG